MLHCPCLCSVFIVVKMLHHFLVNFLAILLLSSVCESAPLEAGVQFDKRADGLPLLKLPYGTWRASKYNPNGDVCRTTSVQGHERPLIVIRSMYSRIFASEPHQSEILDGRNQHLRLSRLQYRMEATALFVSKRPSKARN